MVRFTGSLMEVDMDLKDLHAEYGRLCIESEIIQGKLMAAKKAIAAEMSKPKGEKADAPVE